MVQLVKGGFMSAWLENGIVGDQYSRWPECSAHGADVFGFVKQENKSKSQVSVHPLA